ncbi:MAG TPA: SMP-30/gluconolactonase/LRE family protein [Burkholderiaceae bacterium]
METTRHDTMDLAFPQRATLGEGLQWHAPTASWWWTDIEGAAIHAWNPERSEASSYKLPDRVGSFVHCRSGRILAGMAKWIGMVTLPQEAAARAPQVQSVVAVDAAEWRTRVNDGRTDRRGYYVFGTMNEAPERCPIGSFYQYSMRHGLRRLALPAVAIANSICFSLDGKTMYFADTMARRIMQCEYEAETAQVGTPRLFAELNTPGAWPDGSIIDAEGCLWNAQWGGASVVRYAPDGSVLRVLRVPVKNPTCPAFGTAQFNRLMVTTARQEMSAEELERMPEAGSLFTLAEAGVKGVPDALFDDSDV